MFFEKEIPMELCFCKKFLKTPVDFCLWGKLYVFPKLYFFRILNHCTARGLQRFFKAYFCTYSRILHSTYRYVCIVVLHMKKAYYHGYIKMVDARLPKKSPKATLTLKKGVLEWKFWKTPFAPKLTICICNNFYFQSFFIGLSKRAKKCQKPPNFAVFDTFWLFLIIQSKNSEKQSCCK